MPISPGELYEPRAVDLNDLETMLAEWREGRLKFESGALVNVGPSSVCSVKVPSGTTVTPGDVLGLGDPVISPSDDLSEFRANFAFQGAVPSTSTPHYGQYGIVQDAQEANGFCRCVIAGLTFVKLNITHAADRACEIANGVSTSLKTGWVGTSRILWKSTGTGSTDKWGLIRVGDTIDQFFGKPNAAAAIGDTNIVVNAWKADFTGSAIGPQILNCCNFSTALNTTDKVVGVVDNGVAVISRLNCG